MTLSLLSTVEDTTCDGIVYPHAMLGAWARLYDAITLWKLVESSKGEALLQLLKKKLEVPRADGRLIMSQEQVKYVFTLLENFEQDMEPIVDRNWHIYPHAIEKVMQQDAQLVDVWERDSGTIYSLANTAFQILGVRFFLKGAVCLQSEVELGE